MKIKIDIDNEKALKKASREIAFERYGGGQFVCMNRPHKNKKKYDRKRNKKETSKLLDASSFLFSWYWLNF